MFSGGGFERDVLINLGHLNMRSPVGGCLGRIAFLLEEIYVLGGFEVFKVMCQYPVQSLCYLLVNQVVHSWLLLLSQACLLLTISSQ